MKPIHLKYLTLFLAIITAFFLGRESKEINTSNNFQPHYFSDSLQKNPSNTIYQDNSLMPNQALDDNTIVYRCGHSHIYHPSKNHASFKRCKSKVYELTVKRANQLGMRHCKCSY